MGSPRRSRTTLLCVANFPANTGFAWTFIETLYARVATRLQERGVRTLVAYPRIDEAPSTLAGSPAVPVELPVVFGTLGGWASLLRFVRREKVELLYMSDRPAWHPGYVLLRVAGVRHIVVHDHTSGERTRPRGVKHLLKRISRRAPGMVADRVLAVSDFVRRRAIEVGMVPHRRVHTVWNSVDLSAFAESDRGAVRDRIGLPRDRPLVACASRAAPEKGIDVLLRAFDKVAGRASGLTLRPVLVYAGDGPAMDEIRSLRMSLAARDDIVLTGYRDDASEILAAADLCVVPSRWAEAFGMAALEPMSRGVPVIASEVGGLPEVVVHDETGRLVPPGDPDALARAIDGLLEDPDERSRLGREGRARARERFAMDGQVDELVRHLEAGLDPSG